MKPLYLLDTCVVSETAKAVPDNHVLKNLAKYDGMTVISAVVWHELRYGVDRLPEGDRKRRLNAFLVDAVMPFLPVLPYDDHAAWIHATIRARLEQRGLSVSFADGQIAATAIANNLILVTRNLVDFQNIDGLRTEDWFAVSGK